MKQKTPLRTTLKKGTKGTGLFVEPKTPDLPPIS